MVELVVFPRIRCGGRCECGFGLSLWRWVWRCRTEETSKLIASVVIPLHFAPLARIYTQSTNLTNLMPGKRKLLCTNVINTNQYANTLFNSNRSNYYKLSRLKQSFFLFFICEKICFNFNVVRYIILVYFCFYAKPFLIRIKFAIRWHSASQALTLMGAKQSPTLDLESRQISALISEWSPHRTASFHTQDFTRTLCLSERAQNDGIVPCRFVYLHERKNTSIQ